MFKFCKEKYFYFNAWLMNKKPNLICSWKNGILDTLYYEHVFDRFETFWIPNCLQELQMISVNLQARDILIFITGRTFTTDITRRRTHGRTYLELNDNWIMIKEKDLNKMIYFYTSVEIYNKPFEKCKWFLPVYWPSHITWNL